MPGPCFRLCALCAKLRYSLFSEHRDFISRFVLSFPLYAQIAVVPSVSLLNIASCMWRISNFTAVLGRSMLSFCLRQARYSWCFAANALPLIIFLVLYAERFAQYASSCALFIVLCAFRSARCALCAARFEPCAVRCALCAFLSCALFIERCARCYMRCAMCTLFRVLCTVRCALYALSCALYCARCTVFVALCALHCTFRARRFVELRTSRLACNVVR